MISGKGSMRSALWLAVAALGALALLAARLEAAPVALPTFAETLESVGYYKLSDAEMPEEAAQVAGLLGTLYAREAELFDNERAMLREIGTRRPDPEQRAQLGRMANEHLHNYDQIAQLSAELKERLAAVAKPVEAAKGA